MSEPNKPNVGASSARPVSCALRRAGSNRRTVAAAVVLLLYAGCAVNPVSHRPEVVLTSQAQEQALGDEARLEIENTIGFIDAPTTQKYVDQIGARLAQHSPRADVDYRFYILDMKEPNAMALPGGHVFVSRGLLAFVNSEDELANVIGHEIGHVAARHAVQRQTRATPFAVVTGLGAFATGIVSPTIGRVVAGVGGLAGSAFLAPYSRSQENEADEVGQKIAAASGWDPHAMAATFETLEREEELRGRGKRQHTFFDSHPTNASREFKTSERARKLTVTASAPIARNRREFLDRLAGLTVGHGANHGVVNEGLFLHPDIGFALQFPKSWEVTNTPSAVAAKPNGGGAIIVFQHAAKGADPEAGARQFAEKTKTTFSTNSVTINGKRASHAIIQSETNDGPVTLDMTWIAHRDVVYQIMGISRRSSFDKYEPQFRGTARSFRNPTAAERASITELRLRIVEARSGETVVDLAERTGSAWRATEIAVANGIKFDTKLGGGTPMKIAVEERY